MSMSLRCRYDDLPRRTTHSHCSPTDFHDAIHRRLAPMDESEVADFFEESGFV